MSDTPETQEAVERWRQGKINIFDEMARLERERNKFKKELVAANRGAETNAKINNSLIDKLIAMRNERDEQTAQMCQAVGHLSTIAEDCEAWLNGESDEPSMEFIKAVRDYARKAVNQ